MIAADRKGERLAVRLVIPEDARLVDDPGGLVLELRLPKGERTTVDAAVLRVPVWTEDLKDTLESDLDGAW